MATDDFTDPEIEKAIAEYLVATDLGERPDRDSFLAKYPAIASQLIEFLDHHQRLESACNEAFHHDPGQSHKSHNTVIPQPSDRSWSWGRVEQGNVSPDFGDYEILQEVNRGGMGIVFKARHKTLNRIVALKMIRSGELASPEEVDRFHVETEAVAAINHANIVPIFEVGQCEGLHYFTMGFIDGENLAHRTQRGPLLPREAARIIHKVTEAIAYAHQQGVIHRDLKPANILIDHKGEPFIADFGLAKNVHSNPELTATGQILGTPAYMAPEQASGRQLEPKPSLDVYSVGAVLYCTLTGVAPFTGPTPFDILLQVLDREPPLPTQINSAVPKSLERICLRALAKSPEQRYASADSMAADLSKFLRDEPIDWPQPTIGERVRAWWRREPILVAHLCGIGIVMLIVAVAFLIRQSDPRYFALRFSLLGTWMAVAFLLQRWVTQPGSKDRACLTWATADVILYTTVLYFSDPPRGLLMIGYPMLITASALFYRIRWVVYMTINCIVGFLVISSIPSGTDFGKIDFSLIFLSGLAVLGLILSSMIRRVRSLSRYYEGED